MNNILVSFGATDPSNVTSVALGALAGFSEQQSITIALSSRAPHLEEVRRKLCGRMQLVLDADMAALMTEADLAIGAAGASAYERAVLGLPSILVTLADNQQGITRVMAEVGAAVDAGRFDDAFASGLERIARTLIDDPVARTRMTEIATAVVDGRGSQRLLTELVGETRDDNGLIVHLRLAEKGDKNWLLQLQRAPQTRRYAKILQCRLLR